MSKKVIKRDGRVVKFDINKIKEAVEKTCEQAGYEDKEILSDKVANTIVNKINLDGITEITVETVQDWVVSSLEKLGNKDLAKQYEEYRVMRATNRELNSDLVRSVMGILNGDNEHALRENANKNSSDSAVQTQLITEELSKSIAKKLIPADIMKRHEEGNTTVKRNL